MVDHTYRPTTQAMVDSVADNIKPVYDHFVRFISNIVSASVAKVSNVPISRRFQELRILFI